jgi:hypothetical protein
MYKHRALLSDGTPRRSYKDSSRTGFGHFYPCLMDVVTNLWFLIFFQPIFPGIDKQHDYEVTMLSVSTRVLILSL